LNEENKINSLVYFHTPWCAHCKSIEPVILDVAKVYEGKDFNHFKVFRIDGAKNEISHPGLRLRVNGFPTLYFFPGNDRYNPIEFDGERTVESIVSFIEDFKTDFND
jgi:thiol-disulfide isomerase/thioredoxin